MIFDKFRRRRSMASNPDIFLINIYFWLKEHVLCLLVCAFTVVVTRFHHIIVAFSIIKELAIIIGEKHGIWSSILSLMIVILY